MKAGYEVGRLRTAGELKTNKDKIQNEITATEKKIEKVEIKDDKKLMEKVKDVTNIKPR